MRRDKSERREVWADVPGFGGKYQASTCGNVRRVLGDGKFQVLKPFKREKNRSKNMYRIRMSAPDGTRKEYPVLTIIASTWCPPPAGMVVAHRNGVYSDNSIDNILFLTKNELLRRYAHRYTRKVVCLTDEAGEPVEWYSSIAEAAKKNYVSETVVSTQCHNSVQSSRTLGRIAFRFDD